MKNITAIILILISGSLVFSQQNQPKPVTQAEYVKMLYDLEKNASKKDEVVEAIRKRGIGFQLTDGLRSLTRSKSKNDSELQRTLEESERRRQNPNTAKLPTEKEAAEIIEKTRANTLAAVEEMPDFTVKQLISRGISYAGTNNWKSLDNLTIAVNYSTTKGEQYKVLAINGTRINAEAGSNYSGLDGSTTGGEFVDNLARTFKKESKTAFTIIDTDILRGQQTVVYEFKIELENNKGDGISSGSGSVYTTVPAGRKGKLWIDRNSFRVLRIEYNLTDIPSDFPVKAFESYSDFNWVEIGGEKYLLPLLSNARFTGLSNSTLVQTRNLIRFKDYQKYGSEVKILDDDEEVPEEKPKQ